jgi:hypothetical protein
MLTTRGSEGKERDFKTLISPRMHQVEELASPMAEEVIQMHSLYPSMRGAWRLVQHKELI